MANLCTCLEVSERDQVALLTGPGVNSILGAALAPLGLELVTSRVHSVHHRPGAGVTVGYTAVVRGLAGIRGTEYLCATTAHLKRLTRLAWCVWIPA